MFERLNVAYVNFLYMIATENSTLGTITTFNFLLQRVSKFYNNKDT